MYKKKIVLNKIVPEEILKLNIVQFEKKKKKKKNYICLLKRNIISIRATGVNLVIKRNSNCNKKKFGKDEALDHI